MGLFDKINEAIEKSDEKKKEKINALVQELIEFHERSGIAFHIYFPEKEIVLKSRSGLTKGIATLTLGLPGYAMTNGTKQETQQKSIHADVQIVDAGVIIKKAAKNGGDMRIPFDTIVDFYRPIPDFSEFRMILLENQELKLFYEDHYRQNDKYYEDAKILLLDYIEKTIKERATGGQDPEELKWLSDSQKQNIKKIETENDENDNSLMEELEKLTVMYEKGLLTDEEFTQFKKKLIDNY